MKRLDLGVAVIAMVLCGALVFGAFGGAVETGSWGLSFGEAGAPPAGPLSREELRKYDAAYIGDTQEKVIYLTFDAGYENGCTAKILDTLKKHEVPAAFFLVGNYIERNADLVRRMVAEGHTVGNHTMTHPDMSKSADISREISALEELYEEVVGEKMEKFYRPPQGLYSLGNLEQAKQMGYKTVFWSLAYADWDNDNQPSRETALEKLTGRIHNGAVVLLHSTSKTNAQVLDEILTAWEEMGFRFAPISELF